MKKLILLFAVFLFSLPLISKAAEPDVNVRVNTPVGAVEFNKPPPPQPIVVVQPPPPQKVVVENQAAPAPPSAGCHCSLVPGYASAFGYLSLVPAFSLPFFLRRRKNRQS